MARTVYDGSRREWDGSFFGLLNFSDYVEKNLSAKPLTPNGRAIRSDDGTHHKFWLLQTERHGGVNIHYQRFGVYSDGAYRCLVDLYGEEAGIGEVEARILGDAGRRKELKGAEWVDEDSGGD